MGKKRHNHATKEGLPPRKADSESANLDNALQEGGRGCTAPRPAERRPVRMPSENFLETEPNSFGEVLGVLSLHELVKLKGRLEKSNKWRTAEIINDEIEERGIVA